MDKQLKFLLIGPSTKNTLDLISSIKKAGHLSSVISLKDVYFYFKNTTYLASAKNQTINLFDFDIIIFRAYNKNFKEARILAEALLAKGKVVIDDILAHNMIDSKIYEASKLIQSGLNYPKTFQTMGKFSFSQKKFPLKFPLIIKPINGQKGQGIKKINTLQALKKALQPNPKNYLIQEFLKIDGDIRVFVVGNKVLGSIKRYLPPNDFRSNVSLGAKTKKINLTNKIKRIALQSTQAMQYEIAGVDLVEYKNKIYVLEVNATPQWQGFKKATKINPAPYIINYALKKYEKDTTRFL